MKDGRLPPVFLMGSWTNPQYSPMLMLPREVVPGDPGAPDWCIFALGVAVAYGIWSYFFMEFTEEGMLRICDYCEEWSKKSL